MMREDGCRAMAPSARRSTPAAIRRCSCEHRTPRPNDDATPLVGAEYRHVGSVGVASLHSARRLVPIAALRTPTCASSRATPEDDVGEPSSAPITCEWGRSFDGALLPLPRSALNQIVRSYFFIGLPYRSSNSMEM